MTSKDSKNATEGVRELAMCHLVSPYTGLEFICAWYPAFGGLICFAPSVQSLRVDILSIHWSPDGSTLALSRGTTSRDIVLLKGFR